MSGTTEAGGAPAATMKPVRAAETAAPAADAPAADAPAEGLFALAEEPKAGDRPQWLPEQFWDSEAKTPRVEALAKAVADLRARLSRSGIGPPESPDAYRLPEVDGLPKDMVKPDDPLWTEVRRAAHEAGVSQAQLEAIARPYLAAAAKAQAEGAAAEEARTAAYTAELARLGPQGRQVLAEVKTWVDGLVGRGILTKDERAALFGVTTADGVRALAKLRTMAGEKPIPVEALEDGRMSPADARRMMQEALEKRDPKLGEQAVRALREMAAKGMLG